MMPNTFFPQLIASMVAALITPLMPGAGPPPTIIPIASVAMLFIVHLSLFICKIFCHMVL